MVMVACKMALAGVSGAACYFKLLQERTKSLLPTQLVQ